MEDNNKISNLSENTNIDFSDIIQKIIAQLPSDPIELKQLTIASQYFQGPIPSPEILSNYSKADPSFPERVMKMAESEIKHRQEMDKEALQADIAMTNVEVKTEAAATIIGQILGFLIAITAISAGVYTTLLGHPVTGGIIGAGGLAGLVSALSKGNQKLHKD
jgi:uncharacterized membrane protein